MIEINNLTKNFGKVKALNGLTLRIGEAELFGFVGQNGAGKTTTMRILSGFLSPSSGTCSIDGINIMKEPLKLKKIIGYVPDSFGTYDNLKVIEYMNFFASAYRLTGKEIRKRCLSLLEMVNLKDKEEAYVEHLSRGMKRRLSLARALIHEPKVLILDEPAAGLDPKARADLRELLRELNASGKTVLISTHILQEISELCTGIAVIEKGRAVMSGNMQEIEKKMHSENPIVMKVKEGAEAAVAVLKKDRNVVNLTISENNEFFISYEGPESEEAELLKSVIEAGGLVSSFGRRGHDLESVFMKIME